MTAFAKEQKIGEALAIAHTKVGRTVLGAPSGIYRLVQ
jgi:hypothetical protein